MSGVIISVMCSNQIPLDVSCSMTNTRDRKPAAFCMGFYSLENNNKHTHTHTLVHMQESGLILNCKLKERTREEATSSVCGSALMSLMKQSESITRK